MIKVDDQLTLLVTDLNEALKFSKDALDNVINGMVLSQTLVTKAEESTRISVVIDKLSDIERIISSFHINIAEDKEHILLNWTETKSPQTYFFNKDSEITEKQFYFILMSFDRVISQLLSRVEEANNGYISFCWSIRNSIHKIITEYMTK